jgi:outer membrane lipoprotein carrier protein
MRIILTLLFLLLTLPARADDAQALDEVLTPIHTLQASFIQTLADNKGRTLQKSQGTMAIDRPGKFRWEVTSPLKQLIIANGRRVWIYDPDLEQVVVRDMAVTNGQSPAFLLTNMNVQLKKDFLISKLPDQNGVQWFSLKPRSKDPMFVLIELGFAKNQIKAMRMEDNLGHHTAIVLKGVKQNVPLRANLFTFSPPARVDIIDETKKH